MSAIALRSVVKHYGAVQVVHGVDLEIEEGEFVVLLGPSGCGKTTTLRMVAGLEDVSAGELSIGGRVVNDVAPRDRGVAMVFQNYALYPHMSVRRNMEFALRPMKLGRGETEKRIADTAGLLGLAELLDRRPVELSGGQRQRVAMARAMVRTPRIFLFDEPLSNLDAKLRTQVRWEIGKLHQRLGTTVLYVTHDQVEAMTLADKVVVMRDGHIEQVGTPEEVYTAPNSTFVATFIGSPSMNLIDMQVVDGRLQTDGLSIRVPVRFSGRLTAGQSVTLGIRPVEIRRVGPDSVGALTAEVDVMEYLGNEALLDLRAGPHHLVAEVPAVQRAQPGEQIHIALGDDAIQLFDTATGRTLAE